MAYNGNACVICAEVWNICGPLTRHASSLLTKHSPKMFQTIALSTCLKWVPYKNKHNHCNSSSLVLRHLVITTLLGCSKSSPNQPALQWSAVDHSKATNPLSNISLLTYIINWPGNPWPPSSETSLSAHLTYSGSQAPTDISAWNFLHS